jgi:hypothetical protein
MKILILTLESDLAIAALAKSATAEKPCQVHTTKGPELFRRMAGMPARAVIGRQWSSTRRRSCSVSSLSSLAWSTRLMMAVSSWRSRTHLASVNDEVTT